MASDAERREHLAQRLQWLAGQVKAARPGHAELVVDRSFDSVPHLTDPMGEPTRRLAEIAYTVTVVLPP